MATHYWNKSINLVSKKDYAKALEAILISEQYCSPTFPEGVIKVLILLKNGMYGEVVAETKKYLDMSEKDIHLNEDEKKYMEFYVNDLAKIASDCLGADLEQQKRIELKDIKISNVSSSIQRWYPI